MKSSAHSLIEAVRFKAGIPDLQAKVVANESIGTCSLNVEGLDAPIDLGPVLYGAKVMTIIEQSEIATDVARRLKEVANA